MEIDKLVYNLEADPESNTSTVMEMLRKIPLISVDEEDNIELRGSSNFKILVNGKSSSILSQNYKDVLRSMPASTIRDIEVITDPSSKYEAEGTAGINNIITNKKRAVWIKRQRIGKSWKKVNFNTNVAMYYSLLESNNSRNITNKGINYNGSLNIRYNAWKEGTFSGYAGIYSSRVGLQTSSSLWVGQNLSFTQNFLKKKLSVSASVITPFQEKRKWERTFNDPTFIQTNTNYYHSRRLRINIAYSFGQMRGGIKKTKRGIKNEDVKSGESNTGGEGGN